MSYLTVTDVFCRMRKQQEEERLQRRVQEEAVKFLWKQVCVKPLLSDVFGDPGSFQCCVCVSASGGAGVAVVCERAAPHGDVHPGVWLGASGGAGQQPEPGAPEGRRGGQSVRGVSVLCAATG